MYTEVLGLQVTLLTLMYPSTSKHSGRNVAAIESSKNLFEEDWEEKPVLYVSSASSDKLSAQTELKCIIHTCICVCVHVLG